MRQCPPKLGPGEGCRLQRQPAAERCAAQAAATEGAIGVLDWVDGVGPYRATLERSDAFDVFGLEIRILSLTALTAAKRAAARPKDIAQLPELEAILALRK